MFGFFLRMIVDLIKMLIIGHCIFGKELAREKNNYILSISVTITIVFYLILQYPSEHAIYLEAMVLMTVFTVSFSGRKIKNFLLAIIIKIMIDGLDIFIGSMISLFFPNVLFSDTLNTVVTTIDLLTIIIIGKILSPRRTLINNYMERASFFVYIKTLAYALISAAFIGYAQLMIIEDTSLNRLQVLGIISASILGVIIFALFIEVQIIKEQKRELKQLTQYNDHCINEQVRQYEALNNMYNDVRAFKHDYQAHLTTLKSLADNNDDQEVYAYLETLQHSNAYSKMIFTNNVVIDGILNQYYELSQRDNIKFDVMGCFQHTLKISQSDLCTLLSNGISNAYEAAQQCENSRFIQVCIGQHESFTEIIISNSVKSMLVADKDRLPTTKENKRNHGIGFGNMQEITDKYNGNINWEINADSEFKINISWFDR